MQQSLFRRKSLDLIQKEHAQGASDGHSAGGLQKVLGVRDLTFMGIAAVVGAGIFSTIGTAAFNGGPGIAVLFLITAVTCGFCALCYAEFASRVPIAGSAYTYAYVSFGELIAWIIGWALILEYAIGNIVVAISWSGYFNNLLRGFGIQLPGWLLKDPFTASRNYAEAQAALQSGSPLTDTLKEAVAAWDNAPLIGNWRFFVNLPAFLIVCVITWLAYIGIRESKKTTNFMVVFKLAVIVFVIIMGGMYVDTSNWTPFMPKGFTGVLAGVSAVFYAYIGFDAISTTAEECRNPQHDLPRGMIYSLIICTVLYILIALVLTGMVSYTELKVDDPLAYVFDKLGLKWAGYLISVSAVVATTSVLLVFQLGQPRIWMSMSRDGLLPARFGKVHTRFKTPSFSTILSGLAVAIASLVLPSMLMTDLTSIGTLFAFVIVCFGVLALPRADGQRRGSFRLPYINGQYLVPAVVILFLFLSRHRLSDAVSHIRNEGYQEILFLVFVLIALFVAARAFLNKSSAIPVFGALCCLYLMIEIPAVSWLWFFAWMGIGLCIYFMYGYRRSKIAVNQRT